MGRPRFDRQLLLDAITTQPHRGRGVVRVNERDLGRQLGWNRCTVAAAITDLEVAGHLRRMKVKGRDGLLLSLPHGREHAL